MKQLSLLFVAILCYLSALSTHQRAAEIIYEHVEGLTYDFKIIMYTFTPSQADDQRREMPINWGDGTGEEIERKIFDDIAGEDNVTYNEYRGRHTFPGPGTYTISVEDPNRNGGVVNIPNSINVPMFVETQLVINPFLGNNNSVKLLNQPVDIGCVGRTFVHNPGAFDPDGDSLSYKLVVCKGAGGLDIPGYTFPFADEFFTIDSIGGDVVWQTPQFQGEYNIAFIVEEWRSGIRIGFVRRDMQIEILACDNEPPEITAVRDTCVLAGTNISFEVWAFDPDGDQVTLTATGGPFEQSESPATLIPDTNSGTPDVFSTFSWNTVCNHIQKEPYDVTFKARDNGVPAKLSTFETSRITVIAPAPENLTAEAFGATIRLNWDQSPCPNAIGYEVYRRAGASGFEPGNCITGVPPSTGFVRIATVEGIENSNYVDDDSQNLVIGIEYCYLVIAYFIDGAESYASNEACASLKRDVPIITHVSNDSLDLNSGRVLVDWSRPVDLDTIQFPGPYRYLLYRNNGLVWTNPVLVASLNGLDDTIYVDNEVNLNTHDQSYTYQVDLESTSIGFIGSSPRASSIFLNLTPTDRAMILDYAPSVPWINELYVIYRKDPGSTIYDSITTVSQTTYRDEGLTNYEEYCYYVKSIGAYSVAGIANPLINYSQLACEIPVDNVPPCDPVLSLETDCELRQNVLSWNLPFDSCNQDVGSYQVFYSPDLETNLTEIARIQNPANTIFIHSGIQNVIGCYAVKAIDTVGNISAFSNRFCVNFNACPAYIIPNVFTPNGDGVNEFLQPSQINDPSDPRSVVQKVELVIFNRWGKQVFQTEDPQINWDGTNQNTGQDCSDGVYYYVAQVFIVGLEGLDSYRLEGSVTLLR